MDFHLKQWRQTDDSSSPALSLFSSEPMATTKPSPTTNPKEMMMGMGGGYFSMGQWQELEVQALIYRHMLTGSPIPPQLLNLLFTNTTTTTPTNPSFYSLSNFSPLYQTGGGYWGRGGMDPEPGRCRRTDGKKWRCSRDVVAGHKYCERHVHRGRNRSRKPVEVPTSSTATAAGEYGGGVVKKPNATSGVQPYKALAAAGGGGAGGGAAHCGGGSGHSPFFDQLHLHQRISESSVAMIESENKSSGGGGGRVLRPFFDDWPRTVHEQETLATSLSISVPGNAASDFSLKLSTGNGAGEREPRAQLSWGAHHAAAAGGPLAEALRSSSTSNSSSPTSVLHQLQRGAANASDTSYITT